MEIPFDKIFTSPWLRATQTAAILSEVLMLEPHRRNCRNWPETTLPANSWRRFSTGRDATCCWLAISRCSAMPLRSLLGAAGKCEIDLRKSGACAIQVDALPPRKPAVLHWLLTSKQLRASGK